MRCDKATTAFALEGSEDFEQGEIEEILAQLNTLPRQMRGRQALVLASSLLEIAAFDLAGRVDNNDSGALIEAAALLSQRLLEDQSDDRLPNYPLH